MILATASAVIALAISEGCKLKEPIEYHEVAPLIFLPNTNKPAKTIKIIIYKIDENRSNSLTSIKKIKIINGKLNAIQSN